MVHTFKTLASDIRRNISVQDYLALAFHAYMLLRAFTAPPSTQIAFVQNLALLLLVTTLFTVTAVRGELLRPGHLRALIYRVGIFVPVAGSYLEMRALLPALDLQLVDQTLLGIDRALFGETPAQLLSIFNRTGVVEWFSFFYYSYFVWLAVLLVPTLLFDRGRRMQELLFGAMIVACVGHIGYTLVPGVGPWGALHFDEPLRGGFWWAQVNAVVSSAGAQMDIFPSLHTAFSVYFALHAFGHRERRLNRWLWPVLAFFALNIVAATLILRWHYGIDLVAGIALAVFARRASVWAADHEARRNAGIVRQPVWLPWIGVGQRLDRS